MLSDLSVRCRIARHLASIAARSDGSMLLAPPRMTSPLIRSSVLLMIMSELLSRAASDATRTFIAILSTPCGISGASELATARRSHEGWQHIVMSAAWRWRERSSVSPSSATRSGCCRW